VYFKPTTIVIENSNREVLAAKRSLTGDLSPSYSVSKNISIGPYYMYIRNFDSNMPVNTHFLSLRGAFSNIKLSKLFYFRLNPQLYYLNIDKEYGFYFNASASFHRLNFPLSVSGLINKAIKTNISAGEDFLWNIGLTYSFNKKFTEKQ
jgi:hypothetical protein